MLSDNTQQQDEFEISRLLKVWAYARDNGDWDALANCFQPDATIHISWISSTAKEFIEKSKVMLSEFKHGEHGKHNLGSALIYTDSDRAISECHVELLRRIDDNGFKFDTQTWGRFHDLFERREDGVWRIVKRTMVYEKDRLEPVNPADVPEGYFENMDLSQFPPACRYLCYRLSLGGRKPMDDIVMVYSEAETALKVEQQRWLAGS